jgi:predicted RNA-binding Zn ribbon-like protein
METMAEADDGDASSAPGRLRLVQELLNTADLEGGGELFTTVERTTAWLREKGLLAARDALDPGDVALLVVVREALRDLAAANHGEPLDRAAVAALNRQAAAAPLVVHVDDDGSPTLAPAGRGLARAVGALLAIVQEASADGTWSRLKVCRSSSCRWAFYDRSRNRSGHWCSMAVCGNRAKVRSFRERHQGAG